MKNYDVMDTSDSYTYGLDLSKIKLDLPKEAKKNKVPRRVIRDVDCRYAAEKIQEDWE